MILGAAILFGVDVRDWLSIALAAGWLAYGLWWLRRDAAEHPDLPHWDPAGYPPDSPAQQNAPPGSESGGASRRNTRRRDGSRPD